MTNPIFHRVAFEGSGTPLPELAMVAHVRFKRARAPGLKPHLHKGVYEIFHVVRGRMAWWIEKDTYNLSKGDVFIVRHGQLHGTLGTGFQPCEYYFIQLRVGKNEAFLPGLPRSEASEIREQLEDLNRVTFPGSPELKDHYQRLIRETKDRNPFCPSRNGQGTLIYQIRT